MPSLQSENNLLWLDLEMTGLDPQRHTIIEIATLITDNDLNVIAEGPAMVIHHNQATMDKIEEWSRKTHTKSGLLERVSQSKIGLQTAQEMTLEFVSRYCPHQKSPLCGNSIGHDRRFLERYMPNLFAYLHYRNVDVSTVKELVRRWYPKGVTLPKKKAKHLALDDIYESIDEMKFYREHYFIKR
jgi:oligoribonuclease